MFNKENQMIMKKFGFVLVTVLAMMSVGLSSCKDDETIIIDYYPFEISINVVNAAGENLIAEGGSLYGKDFKMTYKGEDYNVNWNPEPKGRVVLPVFRGLIYDPSNYQGESVLRFGELDAGPINDYEMAFVMPDGASHSISIIRKPTNKNNYKQIVTVDGKIIPEYNDKNPYIRLTFVAQ